MNILQACLLDESHFSLLKKARMRSTGELSLLSSIVSRSLAVSSHPTSSIQLQALSRALGTSCPSSPSPFFSFSVLSAISFDCSSFAQETPLAEFLKERVLETNRLRSVVVWICTKQEKSYLSACLRMARLHSQKKAKQFKVVPSNKARLYLFCLLIEPNSCMVN